MESEITTLNVPSIDGTYQLHGINNERGVWVGYDKNLIAVVMPSTKPGAFNDELKKDQSYTLDVEFKLNGISAIVSVSGSALSSQQLFYQLMSTIPQQIQGIGLEEDGVSRVIDWSFDQLVDYASFNKGRPPRATKGIDEVAPWAYASDTSLSSVLMHPCCLAALSASGVTLKTLQAALDGRTQTGWGEIAAHLMHEATIVLDAKYETNYVMEQYETPSLGLVITGKRAGIEKAARQDAVHRGQPLLVMSGKRDAIKWLDWLSTSSIPAKLYCPADMTLKNAGLMRMMLIHDLPGKKTFISGAESH